MHEYFPLLIVGAVIGVIAAVFLVAYFTVKDSENDADRTRNMPDSEIIRRLMQYARPYWKEFTLVFFIMVVSTVYNLVSPLLIGQITKLVVTDFELNQLYGMVMLYAAILLVSLLCTYLQAMILQKVGQ